jgi:hypothetical protein
MRFYSFLFLSVAFFLNGFVTDFHADELDDMFSSLTESADAPVMVGVSPGRVTAIPPRGSAGELFYFSPSSITPRSKEVDAEKRFNPFFDSMAFENFSSLQRSKLETADLNMGTCFGISYFTGMWYSRITQAAQNGRDPVLHKRAEPGEWSPSRLFSSTQQKLSDPNLHTDGVSFSVAEISRITTDFMTSEKIKSSPADYRLNVISKEGRYANIIKKGAISHHLDQVNGRQMTFVNARNKSELESFLQKVTDQIDDVGTATFFFYRYRHLNDKEIEKKMASFSPGWFTFREASKEKEKEEFRAALAKEWTCMYGHAVQLYRVVDTEVPDPSKEGNTLSAQKIAFVDPNFLYDAQKNFTASTIDEPEGFGTYLLYFPASGQITFSDKIRKVSFYGNRDAGEELQASSVIDNEEVRFGFYHGLYEGSDGQQAIARQRFNDCEVGTGRPLSDTEAGHASRGEWGQIQENCELPAEN